MGVVRVKKFGKFFAKRGFLLATALILLPIFVIVLFALIKVTMENSGLSSTMQRRDQLFYMAQTGLSVGQKIFGANNYAGYTHDLEGRVISNSNNLEYLNIPDHFPVKSSREGGWIVLEEEPQGWSGTGLTEQIRFKVEPMPAVRVQKSFYQPTSAGGSEEISGSIQRPRWKMTVRAQVGNKVTFQVQEGEIVFPGEFALFDNGSCSDFSRSTNQLIEGDIHANRDLYLMPWMIDSGEKIVIEDVHELAEKLLGSVHERSFYIALYGLRSQLNRIFVEELGGKVQAIPRINQPEDLWVDLWNYPASRNNIPIQARLEIPLLASNTKGNVTLKIKANSVTAGGDIIRRYDRWGRKDPLAKSRVLINEESDPVMKLNGGDDPSDPAYAMDSLHKDWETKSGPDTPLMGRVRAGQGLTEKVSLPERETFLPGGYFSQRAGLTIHKDTSEGDWLERKTFYNQTEGREVTVAELDVTKMMSSGRWPANNRVYASVPVRLKNADHLSGPFSLTSSETVYFKGDFNKGRKPASVMTLDRVYRLTKSFEDHREALFEQTSESSVDSKKRNFLSMMMGYDMSEESIKSGLLASKLLGVDLSQGLSDFTSLPDPVRPVEPSDPLGPTEPVDPSLGGEVGTPLSDVPKLQAIYSLYKNVRFAKEEDGVLTINAVVVDGQPEFDSVGWKDIAEGQDENLVGLDYDREKQLLRAGEEHKLVGGFSSSPTFRANLYPNHEGYLENLRNVKVVETGSRVHLRIGRINNLKRILGDDRPGEMPERALSAYVPPRAGEEGYRLTYDPRLIGLDPSTGELDGAVTMLRGVRKLRWFESVREP